MYKTLYYNPDDRVNYLTDGLAFMPVPCTSVIFFLSLSFLEVQDFRKFTDHFRGIYRIYLNWITQTRKMWTWPVGLRITWILTDYAKKLTSRALIHSMPCWNPYGLYIHLAFTYSIGPSSVVWSELGAVMPFSTNEIAWSGMVMGSQSRVWSGPRHPPTSNS